jgi:glycosyltransferase involved in cell wall biosynthesis
MRVALIVPQYAPAVGGVERHATELARGLREHGVEVEVATCDPTRTLSRTSLDEGVPVRRFSTIARDRVFFLSPGLFRWVVANARRFDVIHAHSYHSALAFGAFVAARLARRRFVLTPHYHGTGHSTLRRLLHVPYRPLGMLMVRGADVVICVSDAERRKLRRDFGSKVVTVLAPNGVDRDEIAAAQPFEEGRDIDARDIVLAAGRLEAYKRIDRTIAAMTHLPDHRLVVIGSGPAQATLEEQVAQLGLQERVTFLGAVPRNDLHRWFRTASVFVSLSEHEAFGITLLEAAVGGAGVVASDIPAHREVSAYVPGTPVRLIAADSAPGGIAEAIRETRRMSSDAPELPGVPLWSQTVDQTLEAYRLALAASERRGER